MSFKDHLKEDSKWTKTIESIEEKSSTDKAKGTLDAIIKTLDSNDSKSTDGKEMLKMAKGMKSHFDKEGSFSPDQAKWIFNTSQALFK
jgi:hypothetical protein